MQRTNDQEGRTPHDSLLSVTRTMKAIVADGTVVNCSGSATLFDLQLNLQAAYYAWDLQYPTSYQLLAFFQIHVLKDEAEKTFRCSALMKLEKAMKE